MHPTISKAIADRRQLSFLYKGAKRVVEPHTYGQQANGIDALSAWQLSGGSGTGFRMYLIQDMSALIALEAVFAAPRPEYRRTDRRFALIYAEV
jgi:hypothetical protein